MEPLDSLYQIYASFAKTPNHTGELLQLLYGDGYVDSVDMSPDRTAKERQLFVHLAMSYRYYDQASYQEALHAVQRAENLATEQSDVLLLFDLASHHGSCCFRLGQFQDAIEQFGRCIEWGELKHDASLLSSGYNNMASVYLASSNPDNKLYDIAYTYIQKSIDYEQQVPGSPALSIRYGIASEINVKRGQLDEAYIMSRKAFELDSLSGDLLRMARRLSQMGDVLFAMNRLPEAEQVYLDALARNEELNDRNSAAITCKQLADLYVKTGKPSKALPYYFDGLNIAEEAGNKYHQYLFSKRLYELFKGVDDVQALRWLEQSVVLKDSIQNEHMDDLLRDYQVKYESMEKSRIIESQQGEIRVRNIIIGCIVLLLLVAVGCFFLLNFYRREWEKRQKAEKQVKELVADMDEHRKKLIEDLTTFIMLHLDEKTLSNEEICKYLSVSNTNLNRQVNLIKGCSIQGYVQQLRMEKAERLLRTSDKMIGDIAAQCGYEDMSYFSRVFRQRYGMAPSIYRHTVKGREK